MSDQRNGGIAWTEQTWNPIRGCSRVSEGCRNCYAESVARRFSGPGQPYEGLVTIGANGARWNGTTKFVVEHLADPLRWQRPRMVFVNSMSDLFHESLTNEEIAAVFGVMAAAPKHTFQVLTKRPERMREWFRWVESQKVGAVQLCVLAARDEGVEIGWPLVFDGKIVDRKWSLDNVWVGVSVESQHTADERIPLLLEIDAVVRWISLEPQIEEVDLDLPRCDTHGRDEVAVGDDGEFCNECAASGYSGELSHGHWLDFIGADGHAANNGITWVVVGGESGPGARPFDLAWARKVVEQCREAGTPCFVKQLGALPVVDLDVTGNFRTNPKTGKREYEMTAERIDLRDRKGGDPSEWPEDLRVREWPEVAS